MENRRVHRLTYPVIGFTTDEGLLVDLDHFNLKRVMHIAETFCKKHKLEGYLIAETSQNCYNIIFNKYLNWKDALTLMAKIYFYLGGRHTQKGRKFGEWLILQTVKQASTVRISPKGAKPKPKPLIIKGKTDKLISDYLTLYNMEV